MRPEPRTLSLKKALNNMMGLNIEESIKNDICIVCKNKATEFKDEVSKNEFAISGLCQQCQDNFWNGQED